MREKTEKLNLCFAPAEKKRIMTDAKKCGMSVSRYIWSLAQNLSPHEPPSPEFWDAMNTLYELHAEMKRNRSVECCRQIEALVLKLQEVV
jgi:hypothetical protein